MRIRPTFHRQFETPMLSRRKGSFPVPVRFGASGAQRRAELVQAFLEMRQNQPETTKLKQVGTSTRKPKSPIAKGPACLRSVRRSRADWQWCSDLSQWYRDHQFTRPNVRSKDEAEKILGKRLHNASQKYGGAEVFEHLDADIRQNPGVRLDLDHRRFFRDLARNFKRTPEEAVFFELCQYVISPRGLLLRWVKSGRSLPKSTDTQSRSGAKLLKWIQREGGLDALMRRDWRIRAALADYSESGRILSPTLRLEALAVLANARGLTPEEGQEMQKCKFLVNPREFIVSWLLENPRPSRYSKNPIECSMAEYVRRHGGWPNF